VEGLSSTITIVGNIYAPVRSTPSRQDEFYERLGRLIDELETKYLFNEPELILMGDFNLPLEPDFISNVADKVRARNLSEYFSSLGLIDCWKTNDNRITQKSGQSRLDRVLFRLAGKYCEALTTDWTFTTSDHCLIMLVLKKAQKETRRVNKRITSLPAYVLNTAEDRESIRVGLNEYHSMMDEQWSASMKLEYLKVGLRTVVGECIKKKIKKEREELENIQTELERRMIYRRTPTLRCIEENRLEIDILFARRNNILESKKGQTNTN